MSNDCYVHMWVPTDPNESWGHYTLFVKGTITLFGKQVTNAVFSYRSDSKLYIFPKEAYADNYPITAWAGYTAWKYKFTASSAQISNFTSKIEAAVSTHVSIDNNRLVICTMKSGNTFANYSRKKVNSFAAVAYWCNWLGTDVFYKRYNNVHNNAYKNYMPAAMYDGPYQTRWIKTTYTG
jgi:hypothetical protein